MESLRVLIVDDEHDFRALLVEALETMGYVADGAESAEQAIQMLQERHYAIVFTDLNMPGGQSGLDLLRAVQSLDSRTFTILMTGFATTEAAIQALKRGAYDFIQKPFKLAELEASLLRALNHYKSLRENEAYQNRLEEMVMERTTEIMELKVDIEKLFEGFVKASVTAIEARDPSTSGHSSRVADLTVGLAEAVNRTTTGPYAALRFTEDQIKEIRYASLLHDFGKVGVREQVLVKSKKLPQERVEHILQRLYQRNLERVIAVLKQSMAVGQRLNSADITRYVAQFHEENQQIMELVLRCNEPQVLPKEVVDKMDELESLEFTHYSGQLERVVQQEDVAALRIPKGSLSLDEREEINQHVTHTFRFLSQIPWTNGLAHVPGIAYAHHERLNGKGYPRQLSGEHIPPQSKLMAIADVYDALVAADRPYKSAVAVGRSLEILEEEAKAGLLDPELLRIFIEQKVFEVTLEHFCD